jgi:peptidyl-tRNA hydrolase, PTH1 family
VKIIVGLGNPGSRYRSTRHNVGFRSVDRLSDAHRIPLSHKRLKALYGTGTIQGKAVALVKPITFMNLSGEAASNVLHFFREGIDNLIVIHDDLDLPVGKLRIKRMGGDGGHQGVRSIIERTGGNAFVRIKIGIGRPPEGMDPADHVLRPFEEGERPEIEAVISRAAEAVELILLEGVDAAQNRLQRRPAPAPKPEREEEPGDTEPRLLPGKP